MNEPQNCVLCPYKTISNYLICQYTNLVTLVTRINCHFSFIYIHIHLSSFECATVMSTDCIQGLSKT